MVTSDPPVMAPQPQLPARPVVLTKRLLERSAALPCLRLVADRPFGQSEIVENLRDEYAPGTIIQALGTLVDEGLVDRTPTEGTARGITYTIKPEGVSLMQAPLATSVIPRRR